MHIIKIYLFGHNSFVLHALLSLAMYHGLSECKRFEWEESIFFVVYMTIHNADETTRGAGPRFLVFDQLLQCSQWEPPPILSQRSWPFLWHLGHEYKDSHTKQQRTESPGLGHSMILRHKSRNQREKMERMGRIPISIPKGRCHNASKLPNLTDLFLIFSF